MPAKATPLQQHQSQMASSHTDGVTGSAAEGEAEEENEEKESSTTVLTARRTATTVECGQLTGNEGATPRPTPKFDEDILLLRRPGTFGTNVPHT